MLVAPIPVTSHHQANIGWAGAKTAVTVVSQVGDSVIDASSPSISPLHPTKA